MNEVANGIRCFKRLVLSDDLGSVNPKHKNLYVYMWNAIIDDVDNIDMR